ncbi:MAG: ABC transporter ATP-binding protein [Clostridia bacterium]|nr:ABC transporter ATP-binding protein [Clostridia bacterium]
MIHEEFSVKTEGLTKAYKIYRRSWMRVFSAFSRRVKHKEVYALKDVSVTIPHGEVVGIVGKNGHGKSTLLKLITGVTRPTGGTVSTNGRIVAMLELTSGFDKELTGLENIYIKARTIGMSRAEIQERMEDICAFADIGDYIHQPVRTYSSGMKSRLGFAVSVNLDPDILIVDEVLAVGDTSFKIKCLNRMEEFRRQGKTILFVSHDLSTVKAFCTSCMWIKQGQLMDYGETGSVVQKYQDYLKLERETENQKRREEDKDIILTKDDVLQHTSARLTNGIDGKARSKFAYGEDIHFQANYVVKAEFERLTCAVTLYDSESREIFGSDRQSPAFEIDHTTGQHTLELTMKNLTLLPGQYQISCEIWNPSSGFVKLLMNHKKFEITADHFLGTGTTNIACECHSAAEA